MEERPILFSGEMVRAILNGQKTQTRRIVNQKYIPLVEAVLKANGKWVFDTFDYELNTPYGIPSDRLWVRETWATDAPSVDECRRSHGDAMGGLYHPYYKATANQFDIDSLRWRPSIHMPRWASRITLEITDVRVERLLDITMVDAIAEGWDALSQVSDAGPYGWYSELWESINGPGSWCKNPWVWVINFKKIQL